MEIFGILSYSVQKGLVESVTKGRVLEIGIGSDILSSISKADITTCDIDKSLNPDVIADIRKLPFEDNSFDTVVAFEVIEHLPMEDMNTALGELYRVSKNNVIISVPYSHISFIIMIKIPRIGYKFFTLRIPRWYKKLSSNVHYWEIGTKDIPLKLFKNILGTYFKIVKDFYHPLNPYHQFFILEKKEAEKK